MALCNSLDGGIDKTCDNNVGGIKELYLAEKTYVTNVTLSSPAELISALTINGGVGSARVFYKFEFNRNTSNFIEVTSVDQVNGTEICTQTVTLILNRREKAKRDTLLLLGKFKDLVAIVKDQNDLYWYLGETNGLNLTEKNSETGTAKTDRNGYVITLVGEEPQDANEITAAAVALVINP